MKAALRINGLEVSYGSIAALKGVSLEVNPGEIVAVIGPNGAGKSTLLRTIVGLHRPRRGDIYFNEMSIVGRTPEHLVEQGLCLVPEGRQVFGSLTVEENVRLGASTRKSAKLSENAEWQAILKLFPILRQRLRARAGTLSGGEQQMLAIARALMAAPKFLLLDEPSLGLAPLVVNAVYEAIGVLSAEGVTVLVVEQNINLAFRIATRVYALDTGRIVAGGSAAELRGRAEVAGPYFGART